MVWVKITLHQTPQPNAFFSFLSSHHRRFQHQCKLWSYE